MTSAAPRPMTLDEERRGRMLRRAGLVLFAVFVAAGLAGVLGVRTSTSTARSGRIEVDLSHADVARPALAVPYHLTIRREGGFDERIEVRIATTYLEAFDENGRNPEPAESATDRTETIWTFDPPDGDVLTIWLDTRVEPGVQWRIDGWTVVATGDDEVRIDHPIWILP